MSTVNFTKYASLLENVKKTVTQLIGPLTESEEICEECGAECDCKECKKQFHSKKPVKRPNAINKHKVR